MSTIDASGNKHDSSGRFAGHVAGESSLELPATAAEPTEDLAGQIEGLNDQLGALNDRFLYLHNQRDKLSWKLAVAEFRETHPGVDSVVVSFDPYESKTWALHQVRAADGSVMFDNDDSATPDFSFDDMMIGDGVDVSMVQQPVTDPPLVSNPVGLRLDDLDEHLRRGESGSTSLADRRDQVFARLEHSWPVQDFGSYDSPDFIDDVRRMSDEMGQLPDYTGRSRPAFFAEETHDRDATVDGFTVGVVVQAPDGQYLHLADHIPLESLTDDPDAVGERQAEAVHRTLDEQYQRLAGQAEALGLRGPDHYVIG